jgi:hypothetical protein
MGSSVQVLCLCLTLAASPAIPPKSAQTVRHAASRSRSGAIKGAMIAFPIGAVAGVTFGAEACLGRPKWHCAVGAGLTYAGLGALIGWVH